MAARTQITDIRIDVVGLRIPKFKAGSDLSPTVNRVYFDTSEGSQDGGDYDYSITFKITNTLNE